MPVKSGREEAPHALPAVTNVEEFIKLTESSYGGSVIRRLRKAYKEEAT